MKLTRLDPVRPTKNGTSVEAPLYDFCKISAFLIFTVVACVPERSE